MPKKLKTSDFSIGDAVLHMSGAPVGVVVSHEHARGLLTVKWESGVKERIPPEEVKLLVKH